MKEKQPLQNPVPLKVTFIQRKPRTGNFSLEFVFEDVRKRLATRIESTVSIVPFYTNGVFRRLWICLHAWRNQAGPEGVNHVTGDINFTALVLHPDRTVLTVPDCTALKLCSGLKRTLLKLFWFDWPIKRATIVTTISASVRDELIALTGCDPVKIRVIHVAVSDSFVRKEKPFAKRSPRILHIGTAPNKNLSRLIEALAEIDCTLVVIGRLDEVTIQLMKQHNIRFENILNLSHDDVIQQYCLADMLAFVSTSEGFGMPIVEANVVGRAVVTSNLSSMPEVAGNAACLVDPFDINSIRHGIRRVIDDESYRESLIASGFENAKRFHGDEIAKMYLDIYAVIANKSSTTSIVKEKSAVVDA